MAFTEPGTGMSDTGLAGQSIGRQALTGLTFPEEILVLLLSEKNGRFLPIGKYTLQRALIAAALMELAFADRIDTDPDRLVAISVTPTGDRLLDKVLDRIARSKKAFNTADWIETLTEEQGSEVRERALADLVQRGVLDRREVTVFGVFRTQRYPIIDERAERDAMKRMTNVLFSDDLPDPRDIAMICLVDACGVLQTVFGERVIERMTPRIEQLRKMDLIGREMTARLAMWKLGYSAETQAHPS